jgi:hypothetical protein
MTSPFENLERSLRDGPPDESGYRPAPIGAPASLATRDSGTWPVGRVTRLPSERLIRTGSAWRQAVAIFVILGLAAGGISYASSRVGIGPTTRPTPGIGPLTQTFTSTQHGYSVRYPAGWTVTPATAGWPPNVFLPAGNPGLDQLARPGSARLVVASQPLGSGQTVDDWLAAYFHPYQGGQPCSADRSTWPRIPVSGASGYLDADACAWPAEGRVSEPDVWFDALVFAGGRVYQIGLDGNVDRATFEAILATVTLDPAAALD